MEKHIDAFKDKVLFLLRLLTEVIAAILCVILILAAGMITYRAFMQILSNDTNAAVLDALFVVILLELFYAIRSFINRGSMNISVIVNVCIVAAVKELIFQIDSLKLQNAIAFAVIFLSLGVLYVIEMIHFERKKNKINPSPKLAQLELQNKDLPE